MNASKPSILLIDDDQKSLHSLASSIRTRLQDDAELSIWQPREEDGPPADAFEQHIKINPTLVVTDYDLTTSVKGLFGHSIVGWCQSQSIPVGDFSRANFYALPSEPNLFELRVPTDQQEATDFIFNTLHGFYEIRMKIENNVNVLTEQRSLAAVLAALLDRPQMESQFAAYMTRLGASNSALVQKLREFAVKKSPPNHEDKTRFLTYVLGHVLSNAVLKYPGPILSKRVLCAYLATEVDEYGSLIGLFEEARYRGPFSEGVPLFWRDKVDSIIDDLAQDIAEQQFESLGDYNRKAVEAALNRGLASHSCGRCGGLKGGFWCPFTMRAVCERDDCSVPASSWIPSGAQLSRVERDFYDEWEPILGL